MSSLLDSLLKLAQEDIYPFHMPGHKRNMPGHRLETAYELDITEIEDFDNLHSPKGVIKGAQEKAAALWGAKESFFLVNGSTGGILAAISAAFPKGSEIIIARNCHKAAYHGMLLRDIRAHYLYPELIEEGFLYGSVLPEQVEELYDKYPESKGVFLTSPNYDGVISPIREISQIVHRHGGIFIVDEAHGAHFGLSEEFPESAVIQGADIVIQSLHKTLPSFTQTGLLHLCSSRVQKERIQNYLGIYQTSSPSYLFMSTMEQCIEMVEREKEVLFSQLSQNIDEFLNVTKDLVHLQILNKRFAREKGMYQFDKSKLIISTYGTNISGKKLSDRLLSQYHLQMEMACEHYALALTSVCDRREGFQRLAKALLEIDKELQGGFQEHLAKGLEVFQPKEENIAFSISQTEEAKKERIPFRQCENKVSGEFLYLYPPGVPFVVPGEYITKEIIEQIGHYKEQGLSVQGCKDETITYLEVLS
ncbi:MAG: aminotransferase class I/II-fold pyridoxal phosphate-dependent enzyme [Lachnospiraceae bacterium]|nr:aminotransferase class I/II-fold pyridoxal phosphate-dependent enzyme [Lachnospiraceae bacterium]